MKPLRYIVFILSLTAFVLRLSAGDIRHITMRDGLSSRQVYELEEDNDGFIWMYTNSGLERYDGYGFRHYSLDGSEESNDHIASATTMQQGPDGTVWVATKSGAVYSYDKVTDQFVRRIRFTDPSVGIYHFSLLSDGKIVMGTNKGVFLASPDESPEMIGLEGMLVSYVLPEGEDIYAGTQKGVYRIDRSRDNEVEVLNGTEDIYVKSLAISSGRLYVGPFANDIFAIDLDNGRKYSLPFNVPPIPVNAMIGLGADTLLIGVDGAGVYMIDSRDGQLLRHFRDGDNSRYELSGSTVTDILVDRDGGVWISTTHSGVNYLPPYESSLAILKPERGNPNSLSSGHVNAVYEDSFGERWFGTDKGVSRYNPRTGLWRHYLHNHDYSANVILSIGEDADGNIWVGSYGEGASCINRNTHEVKHLPVLAPDGRHGVGTRYLFSSYCDENGNVWFGGINGLTAKYNIKDDAYTYYDEDCIAFVMGGKPGQVILGGNRGIGIYDPAADSVSWTAKFDSIDIKYPVRSLLVDTVNTDMWIGTMGEGLIRYNYKTGKAKRFTTDDGLSSNTIYSILRDKMGGTWVCTENNIYRYNPKTEVLGRFTNFVSNGKDFEQVSFNPGGFVTANGDVMLASAEGGIIFNPNKESENITSTRLMLTNLILNDNTAVPGVAGSPLSKNIDMVDKLILDHKNNNVAIDFAVINIPSPSRIDYEYMLDGHDDGFKKSDASRQARYTALEPGKYTFKVRALDLYRGTVLDERSLPVEVRGPWWQSWWAKLSYIIIILTVAVLAIGYLRNRRREKRIENQIRTFSNIAHDIRTPMSMIKAPLLSVEQEQGLSEQGRKNLTIARTGIEKTLSMLTAMLEIPGGKVGHEQLSVELCDIRELIRAKCRYFIPLAKLKGLDLNWDIASDMPDELPVDVEKLDHILDNLLSNAIKYTFTGSVAMSAALDGKKRWRLSVKDTGIGIPDKDSRRIFNYRHRGEKAVEENIPGTGMGLLITKRLVRLLRGKIFFESSQEGGTEFVVSLPLSYGNMAELPGRKDTASEPEVETADREPSDQRNVVFVVDDDADMRNFLKETLEPEYDVTVFSDPSDLLERIREDSPDMVLSDVMMPRMRGDELCRFIKTDISTSHIPVILLSGLTERRDVVTGLEAQADDYVLKPFDIVVLKARIRNIIQNRQRLSRQVLSEDSKPEEAEFSNELDRQFMVTVMEKLNDNLADSEFSVGDLCSQLGMSRTSVYNKIRSITGQSVNEFIRIVRLNKAKELLSTNVHNVSEVAYMVGFSDPKYFSTCFKKQFGVSPSKFGNGS